MIRRQIKWHQNQEVDAVLLAMEVEALALLMSLCYYYLLCFHLLLHS